jgi:hypothetical protein
MRSVRSSATSLIAAALLIALPATGFAEGWGINFTYDWGKGDITRDDGLVHHDVESETFGGGISYDPNVSKDRLLNYRVDVNFEYLSQTYDGATPARGGGMSVNQALGFGIVRNERFRLWIGPSIRLAVAGLTVESTPERKPWDFQFGFGPMIGFNYNLGHRFATSLTTGYQYALHLTASDIPLTNFSGGHHRVFAGLTFLYRSADDRFGASTDTTDVN